MTLERTLLIRICGIVQGVGFRPFVSRTADRLALRGSVANKGSYVEVHLQGDPEKCQEFLSLLRTDAPVRSVILRVDISEQQEPQYPDFQIIESEKEKGDIFVSPDIATCPQCSRELFDPKDRRYLHPFINCTACGPRLTILEAMPYDRERTSMKEFPMCPDCEFEYTHAETRRYDAQPVCCNECGPEVSLLNRPERGADAIRAVRKALMEGKIAAVKGIGGFHLCCDAHNEKAVALLRERKHRPQKPFALMMRNLETVRKYCIVPEDTVPILEGHQKPVLLLEKRKDSPLPDLLAPGNPKLGIMLPYAPVQMLLFQYPDGLDMTDALVMTSGNVSGAPICRTDEDAEQEIALFCDLILTHNRKIRLRADDSVMDTFRGAPYMIRRSRGYAPLPFFLDSAWKGEVLGIGGELKNTFCLGHDSLFYLSPYIGDMADLRTVNALKDSVPLMESLLEIKPKIAACDLHPKYNTSAVAEEFGIPVMRIQHHYAHILSCMAENNCMEPVIGVSFDGTGYGTDATVWGGEILLSSLSGFERCGSIAPFLQIGGDLSAKEGWRIATAMIRSLFPEQAEKIAAGLNLCSPQEFKIQSVMAERKINAVKSTSAGRLFDAVSAILGIRRVSTFEGEASMNLQFTAAQYRGTLPEWEIAPLTVAETGIRMNTNCLVAEIVRQKLAGADSALLAAVFHRELAKQIEAACLAVREKTGRNFCALSGGVFQNTLLLEHSVSLLTKQGFRVLIHHLVPPNDGGIALGQAAAAMYRLNNN